MKILVTGAKGFVGKNLISTLYNIKDGKDKTRNLNGIRASIIKAYSKDNGMKYYSLFKPYFKMISALK